MVLLHQKILGKKIISMVLWNIIIMLYQIGDDDDDDDGACDGVEIDQMKEQTPSPLAQTKNQTNLIRTFRLKIL